MHLGCVCPALQGLVRATVDYPENTLAARSLNGLTSAAYTLPENTVSGRGMGDLIAASLTLPENTIGSTGGRGLGCACSRGMVVSRSGMGSLSDIWSSITGAVSGFSTTEWLLIGGGTIAAMFLLGGGRPSGYKQAVSRVKQQYPTTVGRIRRAVAAY
jgi:hypothetical protein